MKVLRRYSKLLIVLEFLWIGLFIPPCVSFTEILTPMPMGPEASTVDDARAYNEYASAVVDLSNGHVSSTGWLTGE